MARQGQPEKIYVKLHQNSPVLICMDFKLSKKEIVDPTYLWIGPNEKTLTGNNRINITKTGQLMVKDFLEPLSGLYTCTLSYKIVKAETQEEKTVKKRYDFMVFAYREPDYSYQMAVRFTTKSCIGRYNDAFFRMLKKILDNLISDLSCHVIEPSYKCHSVEIPEHGLIHELFIAFQAVDQALEKMTVYTVIALAVVISYSEMRTFCQDSYLCINPLRTSRREDVQISTAYGTQNVRVTVSSSKPGKNHCGVSLWKHPPLGNKDLQTIRAQSCQDRKRTFYKWVIGWNNMGDRLEKRFQKADGEGVYTATTHTKTSNRTRSEGRV
ncbi:hypothetical protein H8959_019778 [Pygathrix nigripes]